MRIFYSYSHVDEPLRDKLDKHLSALKRSGVISDWHDRKILAGDEFDNRINENLESADIILFLVSADFLTSSYIWDVEVKRAMERHLSGDARVIPVILRPVDLYGVPFEHLLRLPKDGLPVTAWPNEDLAFSDIAQGIRRAVVEMAEPVPEATVESALNFVQQTRFLETAVADEIPVGESREVLTMIRRESSSGLLELLEEASRHRNNDYSVEARNVRSNPFAMMFPSSGGRFGSQGVKTKIELRAPGVDITDSPATVTLRPSIDTQTLVFLIRASNTGKQTLKVRVLCEDEEIISGLLRTSFVQRGGPGGPSTGARLERNELGQRVLVLAEADVVLNLISKTGLRIALA